MQRKVHKQRSGFSLLEVVVTTAIMALLITSVTLVLRSSQNAWEGHDSDHTRLEAGQAVVRHLVRHLRQADRVVAITDPTNKLGSITVMMPSGQPYVWSLVGRNANFGIDLPSGLLAEGITELTFAGYQSDGLTPSIVPADIQSVEVTAKVQLRRSGGANRTIRSWVWLRSW